MTSNNAWSEILAGVSTRSQASTRRSTAIICSECSSSRVALIANLCGHPKPAESKDLGAGYQFTDVKDQDDLVGRLGIYSVPSSKPPYDALLDLGLLPTNLLDSLVVILLDWSEPAAFIPQLVRWMQSIHKLSASMQTMSKSLDSARDRLEQLVKAYVEPVAKADGSIGIPPAQSSSAYSTSALQADLATLPPGSLVHNLGIPLIIVCSNVAICRNALDGSYFLQADQIDQLEKENRYKEETIDYIQQVLRTICLRYGAALFFISSSRPDSSHALRSYIFHRLFASSSTASTIHNQVSALTKAFAFNERPNAVDRDAIMIPTGWDSYGKIKILREEAFDAQQVNLQWQAALDPTTSEDESLLDVWRQRVGVDPASSSKVPRTQLKSQQPAPEQDFLRAQQETLKRDAANDAKSASSKTILPQRSPLPSETPDFATLHANAIVGPLSSSALSMPGVEKALYRDAESTSNRDVDPAERFARIAGRDVASPPLGGLRSPTTPIAPTSPNIPTSPADNSNQNEVLASFFQSLLKARKESSGSPRTVSETTSRPNRSEHSGG